MGSFIINIIHEILFGLSNSQRKCVHVARMGETCVTHTNVYSGNRECKRIHL
jgi:hypothetical protein